MFLSGNLCQTLIASDRLTLRALTAADAADSYREVTARITKFMSWSQPTSEREFETISQRQLSNMKAGKELHLVIRLTSTNEFVGRMGLHPANAALLETGIWIKQSAQRQGYGREAVVALIKWASTRFHPSGFLWPVVEENTPSRELAEGLGGEIIGTRQRRKAGDKERTLLLYRITAPVR
jgi:RimJ/RimL family protein N-acetyltransferase